MLQKVCAALLALLLLIPAGCAPQPVAAPARELLESVTEGDYHYDV